MRTLILKLGSERQATRFDVSSRPGGIMEGRSLRSGSLRVARAAWIVFVVTASSCQLFDQGDGNTTPTGGTAGVGRPCMRPLDCRAGLICSAGQCQPSGAVPLNGICQLTGDCTAGLYCGASRTCQTAGSGPDGAVCTRTADCTAGLACVVEGLSRVCRSGGGADLQDACTSSRDCLPGLECAVVLDRAQCVSPAPVTGGDLDGGVPTAPPIPDVWPGETCEDDMGAARAYFDVPRPGVPPKDFYRLPYPNEARRTASGGIDLTGHPHPGTILPVDIIDRYLRTLEQDVRGFSTNPVVYFRFSQAYAGASVGDGIRFVDVTPGSPTYGEGVPLTWITTFGQLTKYICPNFLAFRLPHGAPLRANTTYAVMIPTSIRTNGGGTFARSPDLDALLAATPPADATLAAIYPRYAPLRDYITAAAIDPSTILNATLFTTLDPEHVMAKVRDAVQAAPAPTLSDVVSCDTSPEPASPCHDGTPERACSPMNPQFIEYHGRISLPIFQRGTAPYLEPSDGGDIELDATGTPRMQRSENVCFALTVPRSAVAPEGGYPLVIFGHGTGGGYTNAVRNGVAEAFANGASSLGTMVHAATLTIDLPQHGPRRGSSTRSPNDLFFNFANPRAARDNNVQGAADLMSLVRFAKAFSTEATGSPFGRALDFDATRIVVFGHSQGSNHASLMLSFEPDVRAYLLSGLGGDLTQSLLTKSQPVDIAALLPYALLDGSIDSSGHPRVAVGDMHPALAIFQQFFDDVDPVNYARRIVRLPRMGDAGRHVMLTYGTGDSYSTVQTMQAFTLAASVDTVTPVIDMWGLAERAAPLSLNAMVGESRYTIGQRQYAPPAGVDGHFVAFENTQARSDTRRFLADALAGEAPVIGAP